MAKLAACFYAFVFGIATCSGSQVPLSSFAQAGAVISPHFMEYVEKVRLNGSIPGISMGVVRLGEDKEPFVQLASWGRKTEEGDGHDLTPDTLFGLASCSKAFLATSIGLLMDDYDHGRNVTPLPHSVNHFDWDTKVADILPPDLGWSLRDLDGDSWATHKASIRDILGHVSGLPGSDFTYVPGDTTGDVIRRMGKLRTAYELREKWSYNNQMYILGAHMIAHYANITYPAFVSERIFKPLGMSDTTFSPTTARRSGKLTHTWTRGDRRIPMWFSDSVAELKAGPGGVISSAEDMVKWLGVQLNEGVDPVSGRTVIPRNVWDKVITAQWVSIGTPIPAYGAGIVGYGMGWTRWAYGNVQIVQHNGGLPGFSTLTAFSPSHNVGIVILANADEKAQYVLPIFKKALDKVLGLQLPALTEHGSTEDENEVVPLEAKPPTFNLDAYTGSYKADGYPLLELCSFRSTSSHCKHVLADFSAIDPPSLLHSSLYGVYRSVWSTHVRVQHASEDTFNITFTALFPHGYGKNSSAFETFETAFAEGRVHFEVGEQEKEGQGKVEGFSFVIDRDAVEARRQRTGGELKETADAWFEKV